MVGTKNLCVCMYKMVVEITKETWEKCGIKTVKHYNKKENITELWQKDERRRKTKKTFKYCWGCPGKNWKVL